jgi:transposase-like protein
MPEGRRRPCSVWKDQRREKIERELVTGAALGAIARKYGVSKSVLDRHRRKACGCYAIAGSQPPGGTEGAPEAGDAEIRIESAADVLATVQTQINHYDRLSFKLEREGDINGALRGRRNLVDAVERILAKYYNVISDAPIVDQRQQNLTIAIQGGDERGIRRLLSIVGALGEERVQRLLETIAPLEGDQVEQLVHKLVGDDDTKAIAS